jgi:RimJ/RimL family protein N-acetyltransferase
MTEFAPLTLRGGYTSLEPLAHRHHDDLVEAVKDGRLWELWYTWVPKPDEMRGEIERRLKLQSQGTTLPFAVILNSTGQAAGMTSYLNIDAANRHVEIGSTWYRASIQRTPVNTECKLLLLTHAFESWDCIAVEFRTHFFNKQSRRAIGWTIGWIVLFATFSEFLIDTLASILRQTPEPGGWIASVVVAVLISGTAAYWGRWWNRQKEYFSRPRL